MRGAGHCSQPWGAQAQSPADSYPNKPIRIIVPFAPGGIVDTSARVIGQELSKRWGQQVVVENRPGGNGFIGVMAAVKSPADGYTLLMAHTGEFAVNPAIFPDVPYDLDRDLAPITMITDAPMVVVVNSSLADQDHAGTARRRQGEARHGRRVHARHRVDQSPGPGVDESRRRGEIPARPLQGRCPRDHRHRRRRGPGRQGALGSAMPHIKSGRVRVVAVTTATRSFVDKSWPTLIESGIPGVSSSIWAGLFAPKGVPQPIIDKLYAEIAKILELPEVKERFAAGGGVPGGMRPEAFGDAIRKEAASLKKVRGRSANVKPE